MIFGNWKLELNDKKFLISDPSAIYHLLDLNDAILMSANPVIKGHRSLFGALLSLAANSANLFSQFSTTTLPFLLRLVNRLSLYSFLSYLSFALPTSLSLITWPKLLIVCYTLKRYGKSRKLRKTCNAGDIGFLGQILVDKLAEHWLCGRATI